MAQSSHASHLAFLGAESQLSALPTFALYAAVVLTKWSRRYRSRKALARLDAHLLRDIGIDARRARDEAQRMFWQG